MDSNAIVIASSSSSEPMDFETFRSRVAELRDVHRSCTEDSQIDPSELEKLCNDYSHELGSKMDKMMSDTLDINSLSMEDLEEFSEHLKKELNAAQNENAKIENEIEELSRRYEEDSGKFECELEGLNGSLDFIEQQVDYSTHGKDEDNMFKTCEGSNFKVLELSHQIEKNKVTLKTLQDLDHKIKRFEAVEKIEDAFSGLKVVEFEGNLLRLSLKTYIPAAESILCLKKVEDLIEPSEKYHELLIELLDGTMELSSAEIFPNDVYIGEIVDVAKSFRQLYPTLLALDSRSSLEWFVRRVQDRIIISTLRCFAVKCANKSRHSFEYLDRDEIIVAHMVGGIDAFIKIAQGWPISSVALSLLTLKSSSNYSKEISLSFLCKVVDMANSIDEHQRQDILSFADGIEGILLQQTRSEVQPDSTN
ncbi:OLC1v1005641C5 [Oldenlandia corymbosa var. corymbosa]|uniref:OLC1v1005641C5 n=1 Tax=Oldenlandia corymbosa var. corymbosa TaxID=529605 RepID=A0AAV1DF19_OLDCO|nr:OLC1v1005641C5 [Oldenlandia corymbosa var. corymbosa]